MKPLAARRVRYGGFTLIEMVITVAIVGILAMVAVPLAELTVKRTKEHELRRGLREIRDAVDAYKRAVDEGKIARRADESGYPPSLEVLEEGVIDAKNPAKTKIFFLRRIPRDPLFPDVSVPAAQSWGLRSYASAPDAPAQGADVFDVYSLATDTGLNGIAYRRW